jgi:phosphinothricin acetyltransferase
VQTRLATVDDAEAIARIYNAEVESSTATFDLRPRTVEQQRSWIWNRSGAHVVLVAEDEEGTVAGFAALSPYRERPAYSTTVEDSIYIDRAFQRRGVGRLLLSQLIDIARRHGFHVIIARIVGGHEASISLHSELGFEEVGIEREIGRKFGRWLDVVTMELMLEPADEVPDA